MHDQMPSLESFSIPEKVYLRQHAYIRRSGSVRGPFRIRAGSVRGPFGVRAGFVRGPFGLHSGQFRTKIFGAKNSKFQKKTIFAASTDAAGAA